MIRIPLRTPFQVNINISISNILIIILLGDFSINISDVLDTDKVNTWAINNREITLTNLKQRELK